MNDPAVHSTYPASSNPMPNMIPSTNVTSLAAAATTAAYTPLDCPDENFLTVKNEIEMDNEMVNQTAKLKRDHDASNEDNQPAFVTLPEEITISFEEQMAAAKRRFNQKSNPFNADAAAAAAMSTIPLEQQDDTLMEGRQEVWNQSSNAANDDESTNLSFTSSIFNKDIGGNAKHFDDESLM